MALTTPTLQADDPLQPVTQQLTSLLTAANVIGDERQGERNPLLQTRNRFDIAMQAIKSYIIQKHLQPGDPLPNETALCEELGVSRSSVREAVRKLETLHIVNVVHGRGMFVGDVSLEPLVESLSFRTLMSVGADARHNNLNELRNVVEVRRILDLGVAEQVTRAMEGTRQPALEAIADDMVQFAQRGETFLSQDAQFHSELMDATHNRILKQLANSLWLVHMAVLPQLRLNVSAELDVTATAHINMLHAAMRGDTEAYRQAVIAHYKPIERILDTVQ